MKRLQIWPTEPLLGQLRKSLIVVLLGLIDPKKIDPLEILEIVSKLL